MDHVSTPDGRHLEVLTLGPADGDPLVYHSGTPSAAVAFAPLERALDAAHFRLLTYSRPGYGTSTPRPRRDEPWPVAADVDDTVAVLDQLGVGTFVTLGWSGGGPRALACAALLPNRCLAALSLAGVAPDGAPDLDWTAGMGPENVRDFEAARAGREALAPIIDGEIDQLADVTAAQVTTAFGELVDEVDAGALTGELAEYVAESFRRAAAQGSVGLLEDTLTVASPWGFEVDEIAVPTSIWQGAHDRMVPFDHGRWLAANIPGARSHLFDDEGHISLFHRIDEMLAELRDLAGLPPA